MVPEDRSGLERRVLTLLYYRPFGYASDSIALENDSDSTRPIGANK